MYSSDGIPVQQARKQTAKREAATLLDKALSNVNLEAAFQQPVCSGSGWRSRFGDLLTRQSEVHEKLSRSSSSSSHSSSSLTNHDYPATSQSSKRRILVIFIRHFFCGNCQEYLRCLATHPAMSSSSLAEQDLSVVIIGCGAPTLINSYRALTDIPADWQVYSDPSSELYRLLGMQRSLSLGDRAPKYIQRSLTGNMLRSVVQGIRRIPEGDVLGAGRWDVNGGEFLFELQEPATSGETNIKAESWKLTWCHRMLNSRDHTELEDLLRTIGLASNSFTASAQLPNTQKLHMRNHSSPMILEEDSMFDEKLDAAPPVKRRTGLRNSLSIRRYSWLNKTSSFSRSMSLRVQ